MILDTSFLVAVDEGREDARSLASEIEAADLPLRIPTPVIFELFTSVGAGDYPSRNAMANEALVANKPVLDLDENIARKAGVLMGIHRVSDDKPNLSVPDSMVAAAGLVMNEPVVADDVDFQSVDGLAVESW